MATKSRLRAVFIGALIALLAAVAVAGETARANSINVLSLGAGALPVIEPPSYSGWPPLKLLDDAPDTGWASVKGQTSGQSMVFELPEIATLTNFAFDENACLDGRGRGAKGIRVSVSQISKSQGFQQVLQTNLNEAADNQKFAAKRALRARWIKLEILSNQGDSQYVELCSFRAYGTPSQPLPIGDISGTYSTSYSLFHIRQQGTSLVGCYEHRSGLITGTVEGRVMKLTWEENNDPKDTGPAVMVFAPDGKSFSGHWWYASNQRGAPDGVWNGTKTSSAVGGCPNWSGSVGGEVARQLAKSGRAILYGIEFDTDSARLRPESRAVLDDVARALAAHPDWKLSIEGHTDSTGTPEHNKKLSELRAAAVSAYLAAHGVAAGRLASVGYGDTRPIADNSTALGRARNRRVEIVRQ
ncbi:MAG TPA: OmpA family protein [Thermoanaerobaculia bacterium]|nr:OmpA family protein [Thermoanaerobaculia bacterium]